jgi:hypothetical protein
MGTVDSGGHGMPDNDNMFPALDMANYEPPQLQLDMMEQQPTPPVMQTTQQPPFNFAPTSQQQQQPGGAPLVDMDYFSK